MLKKILVALLSAQLIIVPAQAEPQKPQCTQGDLLSFGIGVIFAVSFILGIVRIVVEKAEQDAKKAKVEQTPVCKI
jgi:hypothetical protein